MDVQGYPQLNGSIQVIFGPMFSGKTTEMTRIIKRFRLAGKECLVIKYAGDTRYDDVAKQCVVTHDNQSLAACPARMLADLNEEAQQYDVIGVDEGQFFPDVVEFAERWANNGKIVVIAALDGTFQRKAFNNILELVPLAEKVTKLTAVCNICSQDAPFSKRLGGELEVELIGGADKYVAVCRDCYHLPNAYALSIGNVKKTSTGMGNMRLQAGQPLKECALPMSP
ncbi:hypothetical protein CYMTET_19795 [Cymbomonas tetramitiformis]|uniref:Thymidine kinase n=1 Tax=Cymbomonas tetramitiformis TaxID=36881 RepID=A0AAE0G5A5_9CHLO|nr:hypothetical protein CYMTET_19795 [Cymbomonas tetramitiformis]